MNKTPAIFPICNPVPHVVCGIFIKALIKAVKTYPKYPVPGIVIPLFDTLPKAVKIRN